MLLSAEVTSQTLLPGLIRELLGSRLEARRRRRRRKVGERSQPRAGQAWGRTVGAPWGWPNRFQTEKGRDLTWTLSTAKKKYTSFWFLSSSFSCGVLIGQAYEVWWCWKASAEVPEMLHGIYMLHKLLHCAFFLRDFSNLLRLTHAPHWISQLFQLHRSALQAFIHLSGTREVSLPLTDEK